MTQKISYMLIKFLNKDNNTQKKMTNKSLLWNSNNFQEHK